MIIFNKPHALLFDGGHVSLGVHADYDLEQALTFGAWVKPGAYADQGTLLSKGHTAYEPQVQSGRLVLERGAEYASRDNAIVRDRWTYLAITFDAAAASGNVRLYVDGELDRTYDVPAPLAKSADELLIGLRAGGGDDVLFRGQVAEMALWNTAHTAFRIKQEMNSRPNPLAADLVGWWAMDDGDGSTVSDRGPRGHHGTIRGNVSWVRLAEPITVVAPGKVPLGAGFTVAPAGGTIPAGATQLVSAPRASLPPSGRNGEARKFLDRAGLAAQAQQQAATLDASTRLQQARQGAAEHLDAAHHEAALKMNTARFDAMWFIYGGRIHRADAQGRITRLSKNVPQGPPELAGRALVGGAAMMTEVDARTPWVRTGVHVSPAMRVSLSASGSWTVSPAVVGVGPQGSPHRSSAAPGYAMPGVPEGALVGRVGGRTFLVGTGTVVPEDVEGELELASNDDLGGAYGSGYDDNGGVMSVSVAMDLRVEPTFPVPAADLAVDPGRGLVFWASPFAPFTLYFGKADDNRAVPLLDPDGPVAAVALDPTEEQVLYLTEAGRLCSVSYTGGEPRTLLDVSGPSVAHRWQLAADIDNGRIWWTGPLGIWSATFKGTDARMVIPPHEAPAPVGVAVEGTAKKVYWVDAELHRVRRANLDGTGVEDVYDAPHPVRGLALDEVSPELPELKQEVYWSAREERITPRTPGIVGHWPLDEGEGRTIRNRARPSIHSHLGAWRRSGDDLPPPMRPPATAVELRGGADGMVLPAGSLDALYNAPFTIQVWIRPAAIHPGEATLLWAGQAQANRGLSLSLVDGKPYMGFNSNDLAGKTPLRADRWTHLAFRYDRFANEQAIFVDGVLDTAARWHAPLQGEPGTVGSVGRSLVGEPRPFAGRMAGLHVTTRDMTQPEIRASMADARPADLLAAVAQDPVWADDDAPPVADRPEFVLAFNGTGQVKLGTARAMGLTNASFTVEAWLRPDTVDGDVCLLGMNTGAERQGLHLLLRDGKPYLGFYADDLAANNGVTPRKWTHLAFRYDAGTREQAVFINGALDARRTAGGHMSGEGMLYLGRCFSWPRLRGAVSDLRIWKVARTDEQIARNVRGFREQYALRGPVDASAAPEHLFEFPSEGALVLVSRASADHERRLLAYRARKAAQARAAEDVTAAHVDSDQKIGGKHQELEKTHQESAAAVDARKAQHEQDRAGNRAKTSNAQSQANQRVEDAKQDAARKRAAGQAQAQDVKNRANADAGQMKNSAQAERDRALAERDRNRR